MQTHTYGKSKDTSFCKINVKICIATCETTIESIFLPIWQHKSDFSPENAVLKSSYADKFGDPAGRA